MTFYPDLAVCGYFSSGHSAGDPQLIAIGWLAEDLPGEPKDPQSLLSIADGLVRIWLARVDPFGVTMGRHGCGLCGKPADRAPPTELVYNGYRMSLGSGFIAVPAPGRLYVAPSLVIHYVLAHGYEPPSAFCAALAQCPDPTTPAYERAVLREGPAWLRDRSTLA
jgi:hypothetical protein